MPLLKNSYSPLRSILSILILLFSLFESSAFSQDHRPNLKKRTVDDIDNFTNVGNLGLTVTNFGIFGHGYNNPDAPSCMYKLYSDNPREQVEHLSYGGLWIGGKGGIYGGTHVSTAIIDGVFDYGDQGFEFTTTAADSDTIISRSSIITSRFFDPSAISHQDFVCNFSDMNTTVPGTEIEIPNHIPLGLNVHLESYAWNYSYADAFVILNYTAKNISSNPIEDVFVALWVDASVGNMNYTSIYEPGGGWSWYDNLNGFDQAEKLAYQYDDDGDDGFAESYLGIRFLGASVPTVNYNVNYNQWQWSTSSLLAFPDYVMPIDDEGRYQTMGTAHPYNSLPENGGIPDVPASWMIVISAGSLGDLLPGDSLNFAFAIVAGRWASNSRSDSPARRQSLVLNSQWAQLAYNGEDVDGDGILDMVNEDLNGNGVLDPGEDTNGDGNLDIVEDRNGNGIIDRYILPAPPPSPNLLVVPGNQKVTLYWDDLSETVEDPITREVDFEGYRIYSAPKTAGSQNSKTLLAQFDKKNHIGYNTGFLPIQFDTTISGHKYKYRFVNDRLLTGWPNKFFFAVTAFDEGNPENKLPSLESSILENKTNVVPGAQPNVQMRRKVGVYPNPYRAQALWDGTGERERMIWFTNLPGRAIIRIYTLSGDLVETINHDAATYNGGGTRLLESSLANSNTVFSGGEHAWDLITQYDQAAATGLYLFTVEDLDSGKVFQGKFLIIK